MARTAGEYPDAARSVRPGAVGTALGIARFALLLISSVVFVNETVIHWVHGSDVMAWWVVSAGLTVVGLGIGGAHRRPSAWANAVKFA